MRRDREAHRWIDAGELLDAEAVVHRRHRCAAVAIGKLNAHQPELSELRQECRRELLCLVPLAYMRTQLGLSKLANAAAQELLLVSELDVHIWTRSYHSICDSSDLCSVLFCSSPLPHLPSLMRRSSSVPLPHHLIAR